jgi:hypothetical protein
MHGSAIRPFMSTASSTRGARTHFVKAAECRLLCCPTFSINFRPRLLGLWGSFPEIQGCGRLESVVVGKEDTSCRTNKEKNSSAFFQIPAVWSQQYATLSSLHCSNPRHLLHHRHLALFPLQTDSINAAISKSHASESRKCAHPTPCSKVRHLVGYLHLAPLVGPIIELPCTPSTSARPSLGLITSQLQISEASTQGKRGKTASHIAWLRYCKEDSTKRVVSLGLISFDSFWVNPSIHRALLAEPAFCYSPTLLIGPNSGSRLLPVGPRSSYFQRRENGWSLSPPSSSPCNKRYP